MAIASAIQTSVTDIGIAIEGLRKLRTGSILMIVSSLLLNCVYLIMIILSMFPGGALDRLEVVAADSISILMILIAGAVLALVALFAFIVPGASRLSEWREGEFSTPSKMIKIGYIMGFILMFLGVLVLFIGAAMGTATGGVETVVGSVIVGGIALSVIGAIMTIIGYIGLVLLCFRLNSVFRESLFTIAGILFIIAIIFVILQFIGWILLSVGLGSAIEDLENMIRTQTIGVSSTAQPVTV